MYLIKNSLILLFVFATLQTQAAEDAGQLVKKVVKANGGLEKLKSLKDVSFNYTFRSMEKGIIDKSEERYIFDGEISFAQYTDRQYFVLPALKGVHTQFFNGEKTVSKVDGTVITDEQASYVGHFFRKTNFYWFNMMFKLSDPGAKHRLLPDRKVNNQAYKVVEMTFGENIGDTDDKYILYINPTTFRIDQFLFTVKGFGFTDPFLMKVKYEKINDLYIGTYRKYAPADWEGKVLKEEWNEQITENIEFNNGFTVDNIQSPYLKQSLSSSIDISGKADDIWKFVSNWNNLNLLVPKVVDRTQVEGKGSSANWTIFLKNGKTVKEKMVYYDEKERKMSYKMTETPMPLKDYLASIHVMQLKQNKTKVSFSTDFKVEEANRETLMSTFKTFQDTYLANISATLK